MDRAQLAPNEYSETSMTERFAAEKKTSLAGAILSNLPTV